MIRFIKALRSMDPKLDLVGLQIEDKCAYPYTTTSHAARAENAVRDLVQYADDASTTPPSTKIANRIERFKQEVDGWVSEIAGLSVDLVVGDRTWAFTGEQRDDEPYVEGDTTIRSVVMGAKIDPPRVYFDRNGRRFWLGAPPEIVRTASKLLEKEVEVRAHVRRLRANGEIQSGGRLRRVTPIVDVDGLAAWRDHIRDTDLDGKSWPEVRRMIRDED